MRIKTAEIIRVGAEPCLDRESMAACLAVGELLSRKGIRRTRLELIGSEKNELCEAVRAAISRAELVVLSGGFTLFPALATEAVCSLTGLEASTDDRIAELQRKYHKTRGHTRHEYCNANTRYPSGATLFLPDGAAEAAWLVSFERANKAVLCLPGGGAELALYAESELDGMLTQAADRELFTLTVNTVGAGLGLLDDEAARISDKLGVKAEVHCSTGRADIVITAPEQALCTKALKALKGGDAGRYIYGVDSDLATEIVRLLTKKKKTVAFAESCTGGLIVKSLVDVPGSSEVLDGSLVTYSNTVKHDYLGVRSSTLEKDGAVSRKCAAQMAEGARRAMDADFGVAVTGIAGPGGGTPDKPVGLVYVAVSKRGESAKVVKLNLSGDRTTVRQSTVAYALRILWHEIDQ